MLEEYLSASDQNTKSKTAISFLCLKHKYVARVPSLILIFLALCLAVEVWNSLAIDVDKSNATFQEYTKEHGKRFPMQIGMENWSLMSYSDWSAATLIRDLQCVRYIAFFEQTSW